MPLGPRRRESRRGSVGRREPLAQIVVGTFGDYRPLGEFAEVRRDAADWRAPTVRRSAPTDRRTGRCDYKQTGFRKPRKTHSAA
ncbi:MAG: hypothetical protein DCC68_01435 [Planctomycetota bacterium]|nr:MAG: hypothetical protein DCC68_01435 [Planctomycetota bacterium]